MRNIRIVVFLTMFVPTIFTAQVHEEWVARYNGPGNNWDGAADMAMDTLGNVYVTGSSWAGSPNYATIKYNQQGLQQWVVRGSSYGYARAIAVDAVGNVYVTGTGYDFVTVKYDTDGDEQWVARYIRNRNCFDGPTALAVDASGNVYVTGSSLKPDSDFDYATVKYNPQGEEVWVASYNGPANGDDIAAALAMDALDNVYVTGWSEYKVTEYEYYRTGTTVKYNPQGQEEWVAGYDDPAFDHDEPESVALDALGNVYITGSSSNSDSVSDYATVMYNPQGVQQWAVRYNGPGDNRDGASALAVDAQGNVYVTGLSWGTTSKADYCTIKYSPGPGASEQRPGPPPLTLEVSGSLVRFSLPRAATISLDLYDAAGSKVCEIASGICTAGAHRAAIDSRSLASGVYFARLMAERQALTARVLIIR